MHVPRAIFGIFLIFHVIAMPLWADKARCFANLVLIFERNPGYFRGVVDESRIEALGPRLLIDGIDANRMTPPPQHHPGVTNFGLYTYQRNGSRRVLKIIDLLPENLDRIQDSRRLNVWDSDVRSLLLAERVGGPRVYRWGVVLLPDCKRGIFVEMEHLFFGRPSITLKGLQRDHDTRDLQRLLDGGPQMRLMRPMARLWVRALEGGVVPNARDIDVIFSEGQARWLDPLQWSSTPDVPSRAFFDHWNNFSGQIELAGGDAAKIFVQDFISEVKTSPLLRERLSIDRRELAPANTPVGDFQRALKERIDELFPEYRMMGFFQVMDKF